MFNHRSLGPYFDRRSLISLIVLMGFCFAVGYHTCQAIQGFGYPYNTFLFDPNDRFADFKNNVVAFAEFKFNTTIFATQDIVFGALSIFKYAVALKIFLYGFVIYFFWFMMMKFGDRQTDWTTRANHFITIGLMSLPVLFALDRANIEIWMFVAVSMFAICYFSGRPHWASIFLALAIGAKIFPAVFGIFYLRDRSYRAIFTLALVALVIGLVLLIPDKPVFTFERSTKFFSQYNIDYAVGDAGYGFGHSLWGLLKSGIYQTKGAGWLKEHGLSLLKIYTPFTFVIYGFFAWLIFVNREIQVWKQIAIFTLLLCLLPHVSADYRLLHLFTPLAFYVNERERSAFDYFYCVCFGLILIPKAYLQDPTGISLSVIANPLLLLIMLLVILIDEVLTGRIRTLLWRRQVQNLRVPPLLTGVN